MTTPLYPNPSNYSDIVQFFNYTTSNICTDVSNPNTCGSFLFFDFFLIGLFLILFGIFKQRHSFKDSYASASLIVAFAGGIIYAFPGFNFIRGIDLLFILANAFISFVLLWILKD